MSNQQRNVNGDIHYLNRVEILRSAFLGDHNIPRGEEVWEEQVFQHNNNDEWSRRTEASESVRDTYIGLLRS